MKILNITLFVFVFFGSKAQDLPVKVRMVSTDRVIHRFFDTSPISLSGKYLALLRFPSEDRSPKPGETGEVILVNLKTNFNQIQTL